MSSSVPWILLQAACVQAPKMFPYREKGQLHRKMLSSDFGWKFPVMSCGINLLSQLEQAPVSSTRGHMLIIILIFDFKIRALH